MLRSILWPLPLFMAGIETTDDIYADWIWTFTDEQISAGNGDLTTPSLGSGQQDGRLTNITGDRGGRSVGLSGKRVQLLMARIRELQDRLRSRVEVESAMREINGGEGPFVFLILAG